MLSSIRQMLVFSFFILKPFQPLSILSSFTSQIKKGKGIFDVYFCFLSSE